MALMLAISLVSAVAASYPSLAASKKDKSPQEFETWVRYQIGEELPGGSEPLKVDAAVRDRTDRYVFCTEQTYTDLVGAWTLSEEKKFVHLPERSLPKEQFYPKTQALLEYLLSRTYGRPELEARLCTIYSGILRRGGYSEAQLPLVKRANTLLQERYWANNKRRIPNLLALANALYATGKIEQADDAFYHVAAFRYYDGGTSTTNPFYEAYIASALRGMIKCRRGNLHALQGIIAPSFLLDLVRPEYDEAISEATLKQLSKPTDAPKQTSTTNPVANTLAATPSASALAHSADPAMPPPSPHVLVYSKKCQSNQELRVTRWEVPYSPPLDENGKPLQPPPGMFLVRPARSFCYRYEYITPAKTVVVDDNTIYDYPESYAGFSQPITVLDACVIGDRGIFLLKYNRSAEIRYYEGLFSTPRFVRAESVLFMSDTENCIHPETNVTITSGEITVKDNSLVSVDLHARKSSSFHYTYADGAWSPKPEIVLPASEPTDLAKPTK